MEQPNIDPAALLTACTLVATIAGWLIDRYWTRRKRIIYRVQLNTPIGMTPRDARSIVELQLQRAGGIVSNASLTLLRIRNGGSLDIKAADVEQPLTFTFEGREVIGVEIPQAEASPRALREMLLREPGIQATGNKLVLPRVPLNKKDRFKLLVLLSGTGDSVHGDGFITGGRVARDPRRRGPSTRTLAYGGACLALVGLLGGLLIRAPRPAPGSSACVPGRLQITGSSAFEPLVEEISVAYMKGCSRAQIEVEGGGSLQGVQRLFDSSRDDRTALMAVSDGPAPQRYRSLVPHPVGIVVFALVVNKATQIHDLTTGQLRDIHRGRYRNWSQLGGPNLPISIVSRDSLSGTRAAFEAGVLKLSEQAVSSNDCVNKDRDATAPVVRCERRTTEDLLREVDTIPGALGYAETSTATRYDRVDRIQLDGRDPDPSLVLQGNTRSGRRSTSTRTAAWRPAR